MRLFFQTIAQAAEGDDDTPLFLDAWLNDNRVQSGGPPYHAGNAAIGGIIYGHSLETSVMNGAVIRDRQAILTVSLGGRFDRFRALVGRDDNDHVLGPGYCIFEVWGDGRILFKSDAIRSARTPVRVDGAFPKRSVPQEVNISVRGVRYLRLLTRFAHEFTQQARYVDRAFGCVWASPRLIPLSDAVAGKDAVLADPGLRSALRHAALQILASLPPAPEGKQPPRIGLTPLRIAGLEQDARFPGSLSEPTVRDLLAEELFAVKGGSGEKVLPLAPAAAARLASDLPAAGKQRFDTALVAAAGRRSGADLLLLGALALAPKGGWQVSLQLMEANTGKAIGRATRTLQDVPPAY